MKKLFEHMNCFQLLDPVYIVGTGSNAIGQLERIPKGACIITLNGMCADLSGDYWFCADKRARFQRWWPSTDPYPVKMIGDQLNNVSPGYADYVFPTVPGLRDKSVKGLVEGVLRGNATIAGIALQFCHWAGVKRVVFVGLDFYGRGHYDGHVNSGTLFIDGKTGIWKHRGIMQQLIELCRSEGMEISSLTKTILEVSCET